MKTLLFIFLTSLFGLANVNCQIKSLKSPDGKFVANIYLEDEIKYELLYNGEKIIVPSPISLSLSDGRVLGKNPILSNSKTSSNQSFISNSLYRKTQIENNYNELILKFKGNYSIAFRLFNDGLAFRFITSIPGNIKVKDETCSFRFSEGDNAKIWYIPKDNVVNSGEGSYSVSKISEIDKKKLALTPVLVKSGQLSVLIFEADLFDYPKMFLESDSLFPNSIRGKFSQEMKSEIQNSNGWGWTPTGYKDFIAETSGQRSFPWRCIMATENDASLVDCDMVYRLATPAVGDFSWVKGGKAAWDWWYDWNIEGVDFKADTASNDFYKYVIDFASGNGIEFIEISVGWSLNDMITQESPTLDMKEIMRYAKSKNVGVLLWVCANRLMADYEKSFALFDELKPAGLKVDFMDGDHQTRMKYYEQIARDCAQHRFMVYFHGAHTPTGLQVTFPNVINYEAVQGNEYNKWSEDTNPDHNVNLPFIRNAVGPMDFTPGGMLNTTKPNFKISGDKPMVMGTRCHQLAQYVVFFGPTQMVCDAPSNYKNEEESLKLISEIPTIWDQSVPIDGKVGEYIIVAREKDQKWYVGAMSNWTSRDVSFKTDFLEKNCEYKATVYMDGKNADRSATDYKIDEMSINSESILKLHIAQGGGFVVKIEKEN